MTSNAGTTDQFEIRWETITPCPLGQSPTVLLLSFRALLTSVWSVFYAGLWPGRSVSGGADLTGCPLLICREEGVG